MFDATQLMQELENIRMSIPYSIRDFSEKVGVSSLTYTRLLKGSPVYEKTVRKLKEFIKEWKQRGE